VAAERPQDAITVAVSTRDRPDVLARCLATLASQTTPPAEVVVVDQSQDDRSRAVVAAAARDDGLPVVHVPDAGSGLGRSQNLAFRHATRPIVAVTDDDCVPAPDWLEQIAATLGRDPGLAGVTGPVRPLGPEAPDRVAVATRTSTQAVTLRGRHLPFGFGSGNNFAVRREWLERVGGNDERLGPGAEGQGSVDLDLFYRLMRAGGALRYEPAVAVEHERASVADRRARRWPYGHGVGACSVLRAAEGDRFAIRMLLSWLLARTRRLLAGARRGDGERVTEELRVLAGTVVGVGRGVRLARQGRP
jgi:GT2 family glycosyltransferase